MQGGLQPFDSTGQGKTCIRSLASQQSESSRQRYVTSASTDRYVQQHDNADHYVQNVFVKFFLSLSLLAVIQTQDVLNYKAGKACCIAYSAVASSPIRLQFPSEKGPNRQTWYTYLSHSCLTLSRKQRARRRKRRIKISPGEIDRS